MSTTSPSPIDLIPLKCSECGSRLGPRLRAAVYLCRRCGRAWEVEGRRLGRIRAFTATPTTGLAVPSRVRHLPVWRFAADVQVKEKSSLSGAPAPFVWEQVVRVAGSRVPCLFVPAFAFGRQVVQQLGAGLVERQPLLELHEGLPPERLSGRAGEDADEDGPGFDDVAPVLLRRRDAETVAHYVYLAVENRGTVDMRGIDYELELGPGELVFLPAVYDRRYVRDSGWRLLLREFDGLVA